MVIGAINNQPPPCLLTSGMKLALSKDNVYFLLDFTAVPIHRCTSGNMCDRDAALQMIAEFELAAFGFLMV